MANLWIRESFINTTEEHVFAESPAVETFTEDRGELFRALRAEYGRCISRVYIDRNGQPPEAIGWVFQSRDHYQDQPQRSYLREVWITVHTPTEPPKPGAPGQEQP